MGGDKIDKNLINTKTSKSKIEPNLFYTQDLTNNSSNYYEVAILSHNTQLFIYESEYEIEPLRFVEVFVLNKIKAAIVVKKTNKPDFKCKKIKTIKDFYLEKEYLDIAIFISHYYFCSLSQALGLFMPFKINQALPKKEIKFKTNIKLSSNQQKAFEFCEQNPISLLFGDTGSGKTEIYMKFFEKMINAQKTSIFLMPEISLTPQIEKRLKKYFGEMVAIWHSKITKKKKDEILQDIYEGKIKIVAGARSALFLPLKNLGLIVVDEEHDDSYKSSQAPRYHARDLAIYIAKTKKIPIILGSATPSVTSYYKFPHYRLKGQYFNAKKEIYLIKSIDELPKENVLEEIKNNLSHKKQTIIFTPTRANFKYLICKECGSAIECPFCSVAMSIHLNKNALKCHYCSYMQPIPKICPVCKKDSLFSKRYGTTEIKKFLEEIFPTASIKNFDKDSTSSNKELKKILNDFNDKKIDILIGTQMLSKGHDYHEVNLAVILGIDYLLHIGDYKAGEKAISLLYQISGRAGRKESAKVFIQSINKDFLEQFLDDYELFLKEELNNRQNLYPPFVKLARVLFSHTNFQIAQEKMLQMVEKLKKFKDIEIIGYGEGSVFKISNKYRYQILLRSKKLKPLLKALHSSKNNLSQIDMDPVCFV